MNLSKFSNKKLTYIVMLSITTPVLLICSTNKVEAMVGKTQNMNVVSGKLAKPLNNKPSYLTPKLTFLLKAAGMLQEDTNIKQTQSQPSKLADNFDLRPSTKLQAMLDRDKINSKKYANKNLDKVVISSTKKESKLSSGGGVIYEPYKPVKETARHLEGKLQMRIPGGSITGSGLQHHKDIISGNKEKIVKNENSEIVYEPYKPVKETAKILETKLDMRLPDGTVVNKAKGQVVNKELVGPTGVDIRAMVSLLEDKIPTKPKSSGTIKGTGEEKSIKQRALELEKIMNIRPKSSSTTEGTGEEKSIKQRALELEKIMNIRPKSD